jgi:hypothetical protein
VALLTPQGSWHTLTACLAGSLFNTSGVSKQLQQAMPASCRLHTAASTDTTHPTGMMPHWCMAQPLCTRVDPRWPHHADPRWPHAAANATGVPHLCLPASSCMYTLCQPHVCTYYVHTYSGCLGWQRGPRWLHFCTKRTARTHGKKQCGARHSTTNLGFGIMPTWGLARGRYILQRHLSSASIQLDGSASYHKSQQMLNPPLAARCMMQA